MFSATNPNIILFLVIAFFGLLATVLSVVALLKIRTINKKNEIIFSGKKVADLESVLLKNIQDIKQMDKEIQELFEISNQIHTLSMKSLHKFSVIRFNPFKDIGGNQSFVVALLDGKNSGIVISSLHTKDGTRVYSKPIKKGVCEEYQLTEEETKAIAAAALQKGTKI